MQKKGQALCAPRGYETTFTLLKTLSHTLNPQNDCFLSAFGFGFFFFVVFFGSLTNCCEFPDGLKQESCIYMLRAEQHVEERYAGSEDEGLMSRSMPEPFAANFKLGCLYTRLDNPLKLRKDSCISYFVLRISFFSLNDLFFLGRQQLGMDFEAGDRRQPVSSTVLKKSSLP